eukprot:m.179957 g.179957  ORF g.179957 m.179957 type:complete len:71 (-) comp16607_c0_seq1:2284-2496(-)
MLASNHPSMSADCLILYLVYIIFHQTHLYRYICVRFWPTQKVHFKNVQIQHDVIIVITFLPSILPSFIRP